MTKVKLFNHPGIKLDLEIEMGEIRIEIPKSLEGESERLEREIEKLVSSEEKRKLLSLFIDKAMEDAEQLDKAELIKLGREVKQGRAEELRELGLV